MGINSKCFVSDIITQSEMKPEYDARCFEYNCSDQKIEI